MERRGFIGSVIALIAGLFGVGKTNAASPVADEATVAWLVERLWKDIQRPFNAGTVITSYHCGDGNCPAPRCYYEGFNGSASEGNGADDVGFAVIVTTPKYRYRISVKANYLGCMGCNLAVPEPMRLLADGKRTVETWHRIVADIERMETTGSKYMVWAQTQSAPN